MSRVAIIGDIGGHPDQLRQALAMAGVTDDRLPDDLTVVQVGDLVHRGSDSAGVLAIVRGYLDDQPDQWIQLAGNHESHYLPGGSSFWPEHLADADADLLRAWWTDGRLRVAAAVHIPDLGEVLITHAGLTVGAWQTLGEPPSAPAAAALLNQRPEPLIWRGNGAEIDTAAGPLWAEAGWELYEPWMGYHAQGGLAPFSQVHGHSSIVSYRDRTWRCPGRVRQRATVDWQARQVRVRIGGRVFIGVDPKHGRGGAPQWRPLVLADADALVEAPSGGTNG
jgi:Calcineurin-like phosphoesterase